MSRNRRTANDGDTGHSKRQRLEEVIGLRDGSCSDTTSEFCHGSIVRVKLINFLTYDEVEFKPGSNLNVIVGPNGTGKSSIVCALCIGLGEKPSTLGRAKEIGEFVKHKKNKATVEIELKNENGRNYIIRREILKSEKRSTWFLNGKQTTFGEVQGKMKQLNVQMSNLCQFLPQDKVVEFAKMSQQELLRATEKAVGPPGMYDDHLEIITLRENERNFESSLRRRVENKERLEQRNALLERDVQRYNERQKHLDKIELLEKKRPWVQYEEARLTFLDVRAKRKDSENKLKEARKESEPVQKELDRNLNMMKSCRERKQKINTDDQANTTKAKRSHDQLEKQSEKIMEVASELKSIKDQEKQRQKRIRDIQKHIDALEVDFEEAPNPKLLQPRNEEIAVEMQSVNRQLSNNSRKASSLKEESNTIKANLAGLNSKLKEINDIGNRRLQKLSQVDKEAFAAVQWLHSNQNKFKGCIYEPIMLQINLKNSDDARYLESTVAFRDLIAFVCESQDDQNLFLQEIREKQQLAVNVVRAPPHRSLESYKPKQPLEQIRQFGFTNFLSDLFDAPEPVMRYLYESYHLYNIPIARDDSTQHVNQAIERSGFNLFFTPSQRYKVTQSLYGNRDKMTMASNLREGKLLSVSVDLDLKKQVETEKMELERLYKVIAAQHQQCIDDDNRLKKKLEALRQEKKELQAQMNRRKTLQTQIESKKNTLETILKEGTNIEAEEEKAKKKISSINAKRVELAKQYKTNIAACLAACKEKLAIALKESQLVEQRKFYENQSRELAKEFQNLEDEFAQLQRDFIECKDAAKRLLEQARRKTNTENDLSEEYRDLFTTLPNSVDEIDDLIHEIRAKADCTCETNPEVLREYKRNSAEIVELKREIERETDNHSSISEKITSIKERWLKPLEALVERINEQYSDFFKGMGCAGQVALFKDPDENYAKYGIEIKVMYRSTERLKVLTAHHQSGGERSVATMLYLISLQKLTKCPFRVVDEINQGMDPSNERRVFDLMVKTVCRPGSSQYFLITPKLLPDLNYTERMTLLAVWNGHWLAPHAKFQMQDFINKKMLTLG